MIAAFIISSFVTQTFFYRYKNEGIEYLLYSKPIKRRQIFFSNVFASIIGLVISMALMSAMFFISQLIIPFTFTKALLSTLSFFAAGLLCASTCPRYSINCAKFCWVESVSSFSCCDAYLRYYDIRFC